MPRKFRSNKMLQFTIPGKPSCQGSRENGTTGIGEDGYVAIARLAALNAVSEQGWEIVTNEPVYIAVTINMGTNSILRVADKKAAVEGKILPLRAPLLHNILWFLAKAFTGVVFERRAQIAGSIVVKRYTKKEQNVEVLIGVPKNWGEMNYDLRNA